MDGALAGTAFAEGMHGSVAVPPHQAGFLAAMAAFVGPAILIKRRLHGPRQLGTDLQGGAQYKYGLLWVWGWLA